VIVISTVYDLKKYVIDKRIKGATIGLFPTMGYLHEGHISLINRSVEENDVTIMSIFVNPTQFGPNEDFDKYPRDFANDCKLAENAEVDVVFAPNVTEMYPNNYNTYVDVQNITQFLCGARREGHFKGVATVVCKLFNICMPHRAYFCQKDYQQVQVVKRMVLDLNMNLDIVVCPTIRESDGLAMSSRNVYLSSDERAQAVVLSQSLMVAQKLVDAGERSAKVLAMKVEQEIKKATLANIEYAEIVDCELLNRIESVDTKALLALAVKFGNTRLIDNSILEV